MKKIVCFTLVVLLLNSCNLTLHQFTFIYNDEGPNEQIALKMEELLERKFYNVDIRLIKGVGSSANLDSLIAEKADMALVENYVPYQQGLNSAFSVYSEVLHIFYRENQEVRSFEDLLYNKPIYIGIKESPTYHLMMDLFEFYGIDTSLLSVTFDMSTADVIVELSNLLSKKELAAYDGFKLFSFSGSDSESNSVVEGISLKYPRMSPFTIPEKTYWGFTQEPIVTLSVDLIMVVRSGMLEVSVNDFIKTMLRNRQIFTSIDPLLFDGLREDFDQGKLNIPLHEGARIFLDRDEPSFLERYAELGGVVLSIVIAIISGIISLTKWQAQKKKDKIDEFYEDLMVVKNEIPSIQKIPDGIQKIKQVQTSQNKAFEMLISEKLIANDSFRIYMELSKETIHELRVRIRTLKAKQESSTS